MSLIYYEYNTKLLFFIKIKHIVNIPQKEKRKEKKEKRKKEKEKKEKEIFEKIFVNYIEI